MLKTRNFKYYIASLVSLATFAVYLHSLQNDFVVLDDNAYVYENAHIRSFNTAFLRWAFLDFYASNWHPLTWMSHALDYVFWGLNPFGHHLTNILLHAANTWIVILLIMKLLETGMRTTEKTKPAVLRDDRMMGIAAGVTGFLFGLHPLHVESVAWVAERKDLLCAFFFLLSTLFYATYVQTLDDEAAGQRRSSRFFRKDYLAAGGFFILALLSKPMAVTLPVVFMLLDWYPFNRIHSLKTFRYALVEKLPLIALSLASSIVTVMAQNAGGAVVPVAFVSLSMRLTVAAKSLGAYLWKMVVPLNLVPFYPYPGNASLRSGEYVAPIACVVAITAFCAVGAKNQKVLLSAWLYYVVTLIPVIGIVQVGGQAMADRYTYLPSIGPFLIAGCATAWLFDRMSASSRRWMPAAKLVVTAAAVLSFVLMAYLTLRQCAVWKDSLTVLNYVLEKEPRNSPHVYLYRGMAFEKAGNLNSALEDYSRAIALDPSYADAYDARGYLYQRKGLADKAREDFNRSIALNPSSGKAYFNRGVIFAEEGLFAQAIRDFTRSLAIDPAFADAYANRGIAYAVTGRQDMALADFNMAIELNSRSSDVYFNRGKLYYLSGRKQSAFEDFQRACNLGDAGGCEALKDLKEEIQAPGR